MRYFRNRKHECLDVITENRTQSFILWDDGLIREGNLSVQNLEFFPEDFIEVKYPSADPIEHRWIHGGYEL